MWKDSASVSVRVDSNAETPVRIIKELKDPNDTHKYNCKKCCAEITKRLDKLGVKIRHNGNEHRFTSNDFNLFCKYYDIKSNPKLCYVHKIYSQPSYTYSIQTIDFIVDEIRKDPENIIRVLKEQKNKSTPGAKEF